MIPVVFLKYYKIQDCEYIYELTALFLHDMCQKHHLYTLLKKESLQSENMLLMDVSNDGVDCFLVEMPFNIAFFGQNSADEIIDSYNYSDYFIAGHSLGGVVASQYVNQTNKTDGLILLESYSTSNIDKPVLSIYASNDKLLNMKEYEDSKHLIDTNLTEIVIDGGNHAQVGNYGFQKGDGKATISAEKQQDMIKNEILTFINSLVV